MQGGVKACPQCGNVNDGALESCSLCGYNFTTGAAGTKIPRIIADDDNIIRRRSSGTSGAKGVGIVVAVVALLIAGVAGVIFFSVQDGIDGTFDEPIEIDIPDGGLIEIPTDFAEDLGGGPTFTKASCTRELGDALVTLLRRQAENKPLNGLFRRYTSFGVTSFEYRQLIALYGDFATQTELAGGSRMKAFAIARDNAAKACADEYPN